MVSALELVFELLVDLIDKGYNLGHGAIEFGWDFLSQENSGRGLLRGRDEQSIFVSNQKGKEGAAILG